MQASYTWSKWLQAIEYLNPADPKPAKMISDQDAPNRFSTSAFYALPFGKGQMFLSHANRLVDAALGGWQIQGTYVYQSGFPVAFGSFNLATGATSGDLFYQGGPVAISNPAVGRWFNTDAFVSALTTSATNATPVNHLRTLPFRFSGVRIDDE